MRLPSTAHRALHDGAVDVAYAGMHGCCNLLAAWHGVAAAWHGTHHAWWFHAASAHVACSIVALKCNSSQVDEFVGYSLRQSASADNGAAHMLLPLRRVMDQRAEVRPFPILSADHLTGNAHSLY